MFFRPLPSATTKQQRCFVLQIPFFSTLQYSIHTESLLVLRRVLCHSKSVNVHKRACKRTCSQPMKVEITVGIGTELLFDLLLPKSRCPESLSALFSVFAFTAARTHTPFRNIINCQRMTDDCMRNGEKNVRVGICSSSPL